MTYYFDVGSGKIMFCRLAFNAHDFGRFLRDEQKVSFAVLSKDIIKRFQKISRRCKVVLAIAGSHFEFKMIAFIKRPISQR